ncbi:hypothetical protein GCM10009665_27000 [Kitasatospora nipponensis]|uniref:LPXTG-motif cell wall-anchored protein n=1 Tax=Kitasatospora nipponensis TaxID=258049 RepID=A0ABP4GRP5_9ACTN
MALPSTLAVNQADSLHPGGGVEAGLGGLAKAGSTPIAAGDRVSGGVLLTGAAVVVLRRRRAAR